jgi:hypothetical protein
VACPSFQVRLVYCPVNSRRAEEERTGSTNSTPRMSFLSFSPIMTHPILPKWSPYSMSSEPISLIRWPVWVRWLNVRAQTKCTLELFKRIQVSRSERAKGSFSHRNAAQCSSCTVRRVGPPKSCQGTDSASYAGRFPYFRYLRISLEDQGFG